MLNADGRARNQVIWFTDARPAVAFDQTPMAFAVIDEWMANIRANPRAGVAANAPARAVDSCFATDGSLIASGRDVWDGVLDDGPAGECTERFPIYSTSRRQAGGPFEGGIWRCRTQPVGKAIRAGVYGSWQPTREARRRLATIFPDGVCDYRRGER